MTVRSGGKDYPMRVRKKGEQCSIDNKVLFDSVPELIMHYQDNVIGENLPTKLSIPYKDAK